jgi:alpha-L-rhamnosidase
MSKSLLLYSLLLAQIFFFGCSKKNTPLKNHERFNPVTPLTVSSFANPSSADFPWVRWNFPPETAEITELEKELIELKAAGIAGVEIGQGGEPTLNQIEAVLKKANEIGMKVSLKYKTGAPIAGNFSAKNDYVRKTLSAADTLIMGGKVFNDSLPGKGTILSVQAYKVTKSPEKGSKLVTIDHSSAIVLTDKTTQTNTNGFFGGSTTGRLNWTVPAGNDTWILITFRMQTVDPQPEVFSLEGTNLLIAGYESYWTESIKNLLKQNGGGDIFVDSHSIDGFGAPSDVWSSNMAEEFKSKVGYDLIENLPALVDAGIDRVWGRAGSGLDYEHYYTYGNKTDTRIRADFNKARTDMFVEYRIKPFTTWANKYNLALRLQPEDVPTVNTPDQLDVAYHIDRPEHETLASGDQIDVYRPMASANHISGNTWYSNELAAARSLNYVQTFQDIIVRMNKNFASGQTKGVYHVYPYTSNPKAVWPGYNTFGEGNFANSWGPRNPIWYAEAKNINTWMARNEQVLKQGVAKIDVAVYMQNYSFPAPFSAGKGNVRFWNDLSLQEEGFTWDYLNPTLLNLPHVTVSNNRLFEEGPAYKAFILNGFLQSASNFNPAKNTLPAATAQKILNFAKKGLPVIIVGQLPANTPGNTLSEDAKLKAILAELLLQKSTHKANSEAEVLKLLKSLGILPASNPEKPSNLMTMRRHDKKTDTDYYFLYNQGDDQIPGLPNPTEERYKGLTTTPGNIFEEPKTIRVKGLNYGTKIGSPLTAKVTLEGTGQPFLLNASSGKITPIAQYTTDGKHITISIDLAVDESILVGITKNTAQLGFASADVFVTSTDAEGVSKSANGALSIIASKAGSYSTQLSNGQNIKSTIETPSEKIDLTQAAWNLKVEDWQPQNKYGTTGAAGAETSKAIIKVNLNVLKAWPDIEELKNASGVGTYTYTLNLPSIWNNASNGATLSLGQVVDAFTLKINDQIVPIDQISAKADLGNTLKAGVNKIEIQVSTTLNNRLFTLSKPVTDRGIIQEYGLVGPVIFQPYSKAVVWGK